MTSWPNIDREASEKYLVVIQVKDMLGITGGFSATTTVTVTLTDVNDNGPTFQHSECNALLSTDSLLNTGHVLVTYGSQDVYFLFGLVQDCH